MIPADILFLALAGIAFLGFLFDSLFYRLRVTSVLPLMLLGVVLTLSGVVPAGTLGLLNAFIPYVTAITVAFILFHVGLEIRFTELFRVLGRATAYTLGVQTATGVTISLLAFEVIHWSLPISFVFGFALSGPSSIAVPVLVRVARMPEALRTTLLFESVMSDVLQLLVPILILELIVSGTVSTVGIASTLVWNVLGSAAGGVVAAIVWLALLDRLRRFAAGYTWTLTITMVLATYGAAERLGMSAAIAIFVFGLTLGNAQLLDFRRSEETRTPLGWVSAHLHDLRLRLGLSTRALDIPHILQVQKEVSFFAASFFFVYIGLLFRAPDLTFLLVGIAGLCAVIMLAFRYLFSPILAVHFDGGAQAHRVQRGLLSFNISRGLASAVIATIPLGLGLVIPGFLDTIFMAILLSTVLGTIGVFLLYPPAGPTAEPEEGLGEFPATPIPASIPWSPIGVPAPRPAPVVPEPEPPAAGAPPLPRPPRRAPPASSEDGDSSGPPSG